MRACLVRCAVKNVLDRKETLNNYVENSGPEKVHVDIDFLEVFAKRGKAPFESEIVVFKIFTLDIVCAFLVNAVIGEVHEFIFLGALLLHVFLGREPSKPLFVDIYAQGVKRSHKNVDPQIKLVSVNQQRI